MITNLAHAPAGIPLTVVHITDKDFASRLAHLGIYEGACLTRLDESIKVGPVKVKGPNGEAVLGGWLAGRVVMHLDDDRRMPLLECPPKSSGHIEGVTGNQAVEEALGILGIAENDRVTLIRRMPPMTYKVLVDKTHHEQLNEGLAATLLGDTPSGSAQFCSVGTGVPFTVRRILAGKGTTNIFTAMHIELGTQLELLSVSSSQILDFSEKHAVVCVTSEGLRLYFNESDAHDLIVSGAEV